MATTTVTIPATTVAPTLVQCPGLTKEGRGPRCLRWVTAEKCFCTSHVPKEGAAAKVVPPPAPKEEVRAFCKGKSSTNNNCDCKRVIDPTKNKGYCSQHEYQADGTPPKVPAGKAKAAAKVTPVQCCGEKANGDQCGRFVPPSTDPNLRAVCFQHPLFANPHYAKAKATTTPIVIGGPLKPVTPLAPVTPEKTQA